MCWGFMLLLFVLLFNSHRKDVKWILFWGEQFPLGIL